MKMSNDSNFRQRRAREGGQSLTFVLMGLGLFLLGAVGIAVDISNWWFHRQMAQGAADSACIAGVMDMMSNAEGQNLGGFPVGSPPATFSCSSNSGAAACKYAALNGYSASGLTAGQASNEVYVQFPSSVPGLNICGPTNPPPCVPATVASPFIEVVVMDRVQTSFTGLLSGSHTTDVAGSAVCGIMQSTAPVPIIILNPTCQHAFEASGSGTVSIVGGPTRSIQVNSGNTTCAAAGNSSTNQCTGNATVDLSQGGPNFTGSDFAVSGAPKSPSVTFKPGSTGNWTTGAPISDPYRLVPAPDISNLSPSPTDLPAGPVSVAYGIDGCPDKTANCDEYKPGIYTHSIVVQNKVAIFVPGIYYMKVTTPDTENGPTPGAGCLASNGPFNNSRYALALRSNSIVRPASNGAPGSDGNNGVMFYLSGTAAGNYASVFISSNSGSSPHTVDPYDTSNATCPGGDPPPAKLNLPPTVPGNVFVGPCTSKGTYLGGGSTDTSGTIRGLTFFQDRANADDHGQPSMQGGGGLVISGNMYFHNCRADGTGTDCSKPQTGYQAFFQLQGNPGSGTYVLGNITSDELIISGNGSVAMSLNPNAVYNILKASLLQ